MKKVLLLTLFILLSGICFVNAQTIQKAKPYFGIYGALAMPTGDFGSNDLDEHSGGATTFVGAGIEYTYPLSHPGLSWVSNVSILLNGVDDSLIKDMFEVDEVDVGYWKNIPIMTGLKYQQNMTSSNMGFYGMVQAGLNIVKGPSIDLKWSGGKETANIDMATSFGFSIGGGIILNDRYTVGLRYLALGEPELTLKPESGEYGEMKKDQPISIFLLTVGMRF